MPDDESSWAFAAGSYVVGRWSVSHGREDVKIDPFPEHALRRSYGHRL